MKHFEWQVFSVDSAHVVVPDSINSNEFEEAISPYAYNDAGGLESGIGVFSDGIEAIIADEEMSPTIREFLTEATQEVLAHFDPDDFFFFKKVERK
jgi:hypothetical protein